MIRNGIFVAAMASMAVGAMGQTHYLFVAGGRASDPITGGITANDTLARVNSGSNIDLINILVADVDVPARTVGNWRVAGVLPSQHPDIAQPGGALHWSYLADNVNVYNGRIYVGPATFNGTSPDLATANFIAHAPINADGSLGTFVISDRFPTTSVAAQRISATEIIEVGGTAYLYVLGGNGDTSRTNRIIFAPIDPLTGALGAWSISTTPLPQADWFAGAVAHQGTLIHVRGNEGVTRSVDFASIGTTGDITSAFANLVYESGTARWDYGVTKTTSGGNTFLHIIAGTAPSTIDNVNASLLDSVTGVPGPFFTTTALPAVRRRMTATAAGDMIIVPGGSTATSFAAGTSTVFIGSVATDGNVTWTTSPNAMSSDGGITPQTRSFHGSGMAPVPPASRVDTWMTY